METTKQRVIEEVKYKVYSRGIDDALIMRCIDEVENSIRVYCNLFKISENMGDVIVYEALPYSVWNTWANMSVDLLEYILTKADSEESGSASDIPAGTAIKSVNVGDTTVSFGAVDPASVAAAHKTTLDNITMDYAGQLARHARVKW